ncbi:DUF6191 domain-containing protein [Streptomyces sp. CB03234]|uniref:DUF6191 domain-containing protein n=1 Tax=Streptomyces sp. (strain CB03234) TaxID=1703937 RepID=UPI003FD25F97
MNGNKTVELEQRRVELLRREDESDGAPPRTSIDRTKGTASIVLPQEAEGPCAEGNRRRTVRAGGVQAAHRVPERALLATGARGPVRSGGS